MQCHLLFASARDELHVLSRVNDPYVQNLRVTCTAVYLGEEYRNPMSTHVIESHDIGVYLHLLRVGRSLRTG